MESPSRTVKEISQSITSSYISSEANSDICLTPNIPRAVDTMFMQWLTLEDTKNKVLKNVGITDLLIGDVKLSLIDATDMDRTISDTTSNSLVYNEEQTRESAMQEVQISSQIASKVIYAEDPLSDLIETLHIKNSANLINPDGERLLSKDSGIDLEPLFAVYLGLKLVSRNHSPILFSIW